MTRYNRNTNKLDIWPGYIDVMANSILILIFLLMMFVIMQRLLGAELINKNEDLDNIKIALQRTLTSLGMDAKGNINDQIYELTTVTSTLEQEGEAANKQKYTTAEAQILALRKQLNALNFALEVSEKKNKKKNIELYEPGRKLNTALATKAQELVKYRSFLFQSLDEALSNDNRFQVHGDRFIFKSDVLFSEASATLNDKGEKHLLYLRNAIIKLETKIKKSIPWIIRVDGHTDSLPISTVKYPSNWELSIARALAVVRYLQNSGVNPKRLAATGFASYHPISPSVSSKDLSRNRRIEITLTQR